MADVETNVQVTPNIVLQSPQPSTGGSEALAAALLKSSENAAAGTQALVAAIVGGREPQAGQPTGGKGHGIDLKQAALVALVAYLLLGK